MYYVPTEQEVLEMLNAPNDPLFGIRDKAILEILYGSALRRAEIVNLNIQDVDLYNKTIRIVNGKGGKDRFVPLGKQSLKVLKQYLTNTRPLLARFPSEKAVFITEWGKRLLGDRVWDVVKRHSPNKKVCVHSIRHACATHMLKRGANILYIQQLLGHNSPKTTEIYTRLYPKDLKEVYRKFHRR